MKTMSNEVISKLIWSHMLFIYIKLICFYGVGKSVQWQFDFNASYPNYTNILAGNINASENQKRFFIDGPTDKRITSALSDTLMNVAAAAGQPMPRFPWIPDAVNVLPNLKKTDESKSTVQRTARDSESASKVAAKQAELQQLLQQLYQAEATVQIEIGEVTRSQQIANEATQMLEEATNKVRMFSSDLQAAQENAATCAMRAHTAQLQLAAHDQLMFTARQRVDALSAQMVSVQADLASVQNSFTLNESSLHLEQQGRLNNIYQFQPGITPNTNNGDPASAAAAAAAAGLLILPPGQESQLNTYPFLRQMAEQPLHQKNN